MKRIQNYRLLILIILLLGVGSIWIMTNRKKDTSVNFVTVQKKTLKEELTLSGAIDASERINLQFQTGGQVGWVGVKEGDTVKKYQTIASLDVRSLKKTLGKYLNTYLKTRWDFEQTKEDNQGKIISSTIQRVLDKSQFDLNNSVSDVEIQSIAVELATLVSPIDGVVVRVDTPVAGVNITSTQTPFEIINPKTLYFSVSADQTEVVKLQQGQKTTITLDSFPQKPIDGVIGRISFTPKPGETGTVYEIHIDIPNLNDMESSVRFGMTGDATFLISEKSDVLAVPIQYIKSDDKGKYVLRGKKKERVTVETGLEAENFVEIFSGATEGDILYDRAR